MRKFLDDNPFALFPILTVVFCLFALSIPWFVAACRISDSYAEHWVNTHQPKKGAG